MGVDACSPSYLRGPSRRISRAYKLEVSQGNTARPVLKRKGAEIRRDFCANTEAVPAAPHIDLPHL